MSDEYEPSGIYYDFDSFPAGPRRHWCYFSEILTENMNPFRPSCKVKDISNKEHVVVFYLDNGVDTSNLCFIKGYTLAMLYAEKRYLWMDKKV